MNPGRADFEIGVFKQIHLLSKYSRLLLDDTKTAPERFKKEASIIVEKNLNRLNRVNKNLEKSEIELREFQAKYKLENVAAIYPDSLLLYFPVSAISACVLIVGGSANVEVTILSTSLILKSIS